eukprot:12203266-Karenia_brevis.AAC.1
MADVLGWTQKGIGMIGPGPCSIPGSIPVCEGGEGGADGEGGEDGEDGEGGEAFEGGESGWRC